MTNAEYKVVITRIGELMDMDLDKRGKAELFELAVKAEEYEEKRWPFEDMTKDEYDEYKKDEALEEKA